MSLSSFLTGRNGIYEDDKAVEQAKEDLKRIISNDVEDAKDQIRQAITFVTTRQGFSDYVGDLKTDFYDGTIDYASVMINGVIGQIEAKVADIKEYNESSLTDKIFGTGGMALAKFGEGFASVFEGFIDTGATIIEGVYCCASGKEESKMLSNFIKKDWSHDIFNFYYNSSLAKASFFTEDSGLASVAEGIGVSTGYLAVGGLCAGLAPEGSLLASTTNANTAVAFASGWGNNTQRGLQAGKSFGSASAQGFVAATAEATLAFIGGKAAEKAKQSKAVKQAKTEEAKALKELDNATHSGSSSHDIEKLTKNHDAALDNLKKAKNPLSYGQDKLQEAQNALLKAEKDGIPKEARKVLEQKVLDATDDLKGLKNYYQGYDNPITNWAKSKGEAAREAIKSFSKATNKKQVISNAFNSGRQALGNSIDDIGFNIGNNVANATASNAKDGVVNGLKKVASGVATGVKNVAVSATTPMTLGTIGTSMYGASQAFKSKATGNIQPPDVKPQSGFSATPSGTSNGGGSTGGETGGTDNTTENQQSTSNENGNGNGNSNRTYSGGGSSYTPSGSTYSGGNASTQFTNSQPTTQNNQTTTTDTSKTPTVPNNKTEDVLKPSTDTPKQPNTPNTTPSGSTNNPTTSNPNPNPNSSPSNPNHNTNTNTNPSPSPSNPSPSNNPTSNGSGNAHTGGGYSGSGGYQEDTTSNGILDSDKNEIDAALEKGKASIDDVIKGNITKIPSSTTPIKTTPTTKNGNNGSYVIPTVAGLSAAAAAGIGTKAYLDNKSNNYNGEDSDEIETEEWAGENDVEIEYDDNAEKEAYLDEDDEFGYTDTDTATEETEKYDARNNTELADLQ